MKGTLYGIGVGSGDPELMTLKAKRLIEACPVIALPQSGKGEGVAYAIARQVCPGLDEKQQLKLDMPMTRDQERLRQSHQEGAQAIARQLDRGNNVAFLTLGDPTIYSTYVYLHQRVVEMGYEAQMVPGVPSFCAAAARLGISLTEGAQPLCVIPASYPGVKEALEGKGTKVLMKTGRSMEKVKELLKEKGLYKNAKMVEKCGMEGETLYDTLDQADNESSYFSLIIAKEEEV